MFDDQPIKNQGNVPNNLPTTEPDDMFSNTDSAPEAPISPAVASALGAGALRPKISPVATHNPPRSPVPAMNFDSDRPLSEPMMPGRVENLEEPVGKSKLILVVVIILIVGLLVGGAVWGYFAFVKNKSKTSGIIPDQGTSVNDIVIPAEGAENESNKIVNNPAIVPPEPPTPDDNILFGEPLDTDGDSLTDDQEKESGTNAFNWDSDGDELSDGDEVNNWKTDPLSEDTDKDTFLDGMEVKNGYNPNGPGRFVDALNSVSPTTSEVSISATGTATSGQ
ncbi:MAG: hypothetical protein AAB390_03810 [Patescibacteria group bacterium]